MTYFFNGGVEEEWEGETRILVPSPRDVPSYDLKPEMSADEVADRFCAEIGDGYRFAVVNFANPDMVGHTGVIPAVVAAVETTDRCLGRVVERVDRARRRVPRSRPITATPSSCSSPTASRRSRPTRRTRSRVVVTVAGRTLRDGGELADLAPTCLDLLGFSAPEAMPAARC